MSSKYFFIISQLLNFGLKKYSHTHTHTHTQKIFWVEKTFSVAVEVGVRFKSPAVKGIYQVYLLCFKFKGG